MPDIRQGKGVGYKDDKTGKVCMIRCFACGLENYAIAVASGCCAWCGHDANKKQVVNKVAKAVPGTPGPVKSLIVDDALKLSARKHRRING